MRTPVRAPARPRLRVRVLNRVFDGLFACTLFLGVLFLWRRSHERGCGAAVLPALGYLTTCYGLLAYRLERRRFAVAYYLDPRSPLHHRLQGVAPSVLISLLAAAPLTTFLALFAALARPTDWYFFCAAAGTAPLLFGAASVWPGRHLRREPPGAAAEDLNGPPDRCTAGVRIGRGALADILAARLAGTLVLAGVAGAYVYANYHLIPVPGEQIFPDSLERTLSSFAGAARSACGPVDDALQLAASIEGLSWYAVTAAVSFPWMPDGMNALLWTGFFLKTAMVFGGFVRGLEGAILLACRARRALPGAET